MAPVAPVTPPVQPPTAKPVATPGAPVNAAPARKSPKPKRDARKDFQRMAARTPSWVIPVIAFLEFAGILFFLVQLPVTFAAVRLDFEMHWYIVTDRSLRIRTGIWSLQESTMSFANLQQVEVKQGPLQRLLGLADVHVQSAGGAGDRDPHRGRAEESLHTGIFHSVDNATEIRDLILERLRHFRQAGLGDPDDHHDLAVTGGAPPLSAMGLPNGTTVDPRETSAPNADTLAAAHELLAEARALRTATGAGL
jgi:hypothetical protein